MNVMNPIILEDIKSEITKSLKSINYSQWERQPKREESVKQSKSRPLTSSNQKLIKSASSLDKKASSANKCNHQHSKGEKHVFKTKRQLQEEENRKNILKVKIKFTKEYIESLNKRQVELFESNKQILSMIDKKEKESNMKVDGILRKYEKYQNVKNTIKKKHLEEIDEIQQEIEKLKLETNVEISRNQDSLDKIEQELNRTQKLCNQLSIYKNQEHPEKQLQIINLKKKLQDMNDIHNEEHDNLIGLLNYEKKLMIESQIEQTKKIADSVSSKAMIDMHESLKDMASHNKSMEEEIQFYKKLINDLHDEINKVVKDVNLLKQDSRRNLRNVAFNDIIMEKKKEICTPEMDIELNLKD